MIMKIFHFMYEPFDDYDGVMNMLATGNYRNFHQLREWPQY